MQFMIIIRGIDLKLSKLIIIRGIIEERNLQAEK